MRDVILSNIIHAVLVIVAFRAMPSAETEALSPVERLRIGEVIEVDLRHPEERLTTPPRTSSCAQPF